jgi:hypothetical protein
MQDGTTTHTTEENLAFWPPNSRDFNPIESLCGMVEQLLIRHRIHFVHELKQALKEIWDRFECEMIIGGESIQPLISAQKLIVYGHNYDRGPRAGKSVEANRGCS